MEPKEALYHCHGMLLITLWLTMAVTMNEIPETLAGNWRAELETPGGPLPFHMEVYKSGNTWIFSLLNGQEQLESADITLVGDTVVFRSSVFHSEIRASLDGSGKNLKGVWQDYSRGDAYLIPFTAEKDNPNRFSADPDMPNAELSGSWGTTFIHDGDSSFAIGVFSQDGNDLEGTFLTPTGDYRFLEGEVNGNQFSLSAFDGSHAFLFIGQIENEDSLSGTFYSGNHWMESFTAVRREGAVLDDPSSLTYLKEESGPFSFCFPEPGKDTVCLTDDRFHNKVVIVQIMGTWCPNCMDESEYLAEIYDRYRAEGLEVVALAFEREDSPEQARLNFERLRKKLGVTYPILLAGPSGKRAASEALPQLNRVLAYPTTLVIDRDGQVAYIHTGFNGRVTGELFLAFREQFENLIESLL